MDGHIQQWTNADKKEFSSAEQKLYLELLFTVLGDKPDPTDEDDGWEVSGFALPNRIAWAYSYGVDGMNYCSETEYSILAELKVSDADPVKDGYRPLEEYFPVLDRSEKEMLVEVLSANSSASWFINHGSYWDPQNEDIHFSTDVEFLFENLYRLGKNVLLHCTMREFR